MDIVIIDNISVQMMLTRRERTMMAHLDIEMELSHKLGLTFLLDTEWCQAISWIITLCCCLAVGRNERKHEEASKQECTWAEMIFSMEDRIWNPLCKRFCFLEPNLRTCARDSIPLACIAIREHPGWQAPKFWKSNKAKLRCFLCSGRLPPIIASVLDHRITSKRLAMMCTW